MDDNIRLIDDLLDEPADKKATFIMEVQFQQNGSWQGTITWVDEKKTRNFRSAFEMLKLIDDAVGSPAQKHPDWSESTED